MNERIRELAEQAGAGRRAGISGLVFRNNELEKFAELIVKECAQLARDTNLEDVEGGDNEVLRPQNFRF